MMKLSLSLSLLRPLSLKPHAKIRHAAVIHDDEMMKEGAVATQARHRPAVAVAVVVTPALAQITCQDTPRRCHT